MHLEGGHSCVGAKPHFRSMTRMDIVPGKGRELKIGSLYLVPETGHIISRILSTLRGGHAQLQLTDVTAEAHRG